MRLLVVGLGVGGLVFGSLAACGGEDFESTKNTGGTGGGAAGGTDGGGSGGTTTGGASGAAGSGALGGTAGAAAGGGALGGAAGSGGAQPCTDDSCGDDEYCHDQSGECRKCTDPDEFEFFPPQPLTVINNAHPDKDLHAPRQLEDGTASLVYSIGFTPFDRQLWVTDNFLQSAGIPFPQPVDIQPTAEPSGLIIWPPADGPLKSFALLFDHHAENTLDFDMYGSEYDPSGKVFKAPIALPAPFNVPNSADWAPAYSQVAERMWWVSNRDAPLAPKLYTASTAQGAPAVAEIVPLTTFSPSCPVNDGDLAPWVAPGGYLILFHANEKFSACNTVAKNDLYVAGLDANGKALPAFPLDVNLQNTRDEWPSMSFDMCTLYFSTQRDGASHTRIYAARRK